MAFFQDSHVILKSIPHTIIKTQDFSRDRVPDGRERGIFMGVSISVNRILTSTAFTKPLSGGIISIRNKGLRPFYSGGEAQWIH